jgi:hypothetical protein
MPVSSARSSAASPVSTLRGPSVQLGPRNVETGEAAELLAELDAARQVLAHGLGDEGGLVAEEQHAEAHGDVDVAVAVDVLQP